MNKPSILLSTSLIALFSVACSSGPTGTPTDTPGAPSTPAPTQPPPTAPATPVATPVATPSASPAGVVVTFDVLGETYRILLTDPDDIEIAQKLLDGDEAPAIPNGLIVRGETSVNEGYSWSIDPDSVEFADMTTEVCDGLPSYVEDGSLTGDYYCPWSARVVAIDAAD